MNPEIPETYLSLRETLHAFLEERVRPHARDWDRTEKFPMEVVRALGELGYLGVLVPEEYGGAGLDALALAIVVEEVARYDGGLALTVASHNGLGTSHLRLFGNPEQKRRWLPRLATGEILGAWALTEPGSGSDASGLKTTAVRKGDRWILNGSKMFITQGTVGGVCVVLASTEPARKQKGITAFIVEPGTRGFTARPMHGKMGMRSSDTAELVLEDVEVPDAQRLGEVNAGFVDAMRILDGGRITIGALAVGLARGALEEALSYGQERRAFGQPIANFQAVQFKLADMATELHAARLMVHHAAGLAARGKPYSRQAAMAKLFASEAATRACLEAVQIHGGYGYFNEFPVERYARDAKLCEIGEGTSEVLRMVIARDLLKG